MAINVSLTVRQKAGEKGSLEAWGAALANPKPALDRIGALLRANLEERFRTNTDPWGGAWAPVSERTIAMRGGVREADDNLIERISVRIEGLKVRFGLRSAIARSRQFGVPNNRMFGRSPAPVPARPFLPIRPSRKIEFPPALLAQILETVRDSLRKAAKGGGRPAE